VPITQEELELDKAYRTEVYFELAAMTRQHFVDEVSPCLSKTALGLANGRYDDARKDILSGRITSDEGVSLLQKMLGYKLISKRIFDWHSRKFMEAAILYEMD